MNSFRVAHLAHLIRRFVFTLSRRAPDQAEIDWVKGYLSPREYALWCKMPASDQCHCVLVARTVASEFEKDETVVVAGLLHDIGKTAVRSGVFTRVFAALLGPFLSREITLKRFKPIRMFENLRLYLSYPRLGSELLVDAGSAEFVIKWAQEHHLKPDEWTVDTAKALALRRADELAV